MDEITLSSGRTFSANCGLISINEDLWVSEGYDCGIAGVGLDAAEFSHDPWSADERVELADRMIKLWSEFKAAALKREGK